MTVVVPHQVELSRIPNATVQLLKAVLKSTKNINKGSTPNSLPQLEYKVGKINIDNAKSFAFHQVVEWPKEAEFIHPCLLHSMAFPIHIALLLLPEFPFPLLGLIHLENQLKQYRPVKASETLSLDAKFGAIEAHPKGWLFAIEVNVYSGSELVWQSSSRNLYLSRHKLEVSARPSMDVFDSQSHSVNWPLDAGLGRRYARCSGDYNPIHLTKWSAKLLGFKRHIIHGMWTKARCLSAVYSQYPDLFLKSFETNVNFKQPLYLPNNAQMSVQAREGISACELNFKVESSDSVTSDRYLHLVGNIRAL